MLYMDNTEEIIFLRQKLQATQSEIEELKQAPHIVQAEEYKKVIVEFNRVLNNYGPAISESFGHDSEFLKVRNEMRRISGDPAYCAPDDEETQH